MQSRVSPNPRRRSHNGWNKQTGSQTIVHSARLCRYITCTLISHKFEGFQSELQLHFLIILAGKKHTLIAFVVLTSPDGIAAALKLNGNFVDGENGAEGRHIRVDVCSTQKPTYSTQKSIFIGNLPFSVNEVQVSTFFSADSLCTATEIHTACLSFRSGTPSLPLVQ